MVQFNLLPDVKLEYVKTQRTKRLLTLISIVVSIVGLAVLFLSFVTVNVVQKKSLNDLSSDITKYSSQLKNVKDLDKILTVQNQLSTLKGLHDQEPVASQLFGYITKVTPEQASLSDLSVDFVGDTMTVSGAAPSLDVVSTYTDTLKSATYTTDSSTTAVHAFSNVVLSAFNLGDKSASFTITCKFDPALFQSNNKVTLTVPDTADSSQSSVFGEGN